MKKLIALAILAMVLLLGSKGDGKSDDVTETMTPSTECDSISPQFRHSCKYDPEVEAISHFQKTDHAGGSADKKNKNDDGKHNDSEPSNSMIGGPSQHGSSNRLYEDYAIEKETEILDLSKPNDYRSHGGTRFVILDLIMILLFVGWPVALLFVAYRVVPSLASSSSSLGKEPFIKSKVPMTPGSASSLRKRDGFLTPPPSGKRRAQEPSEWMSPCYGDDAIDISVYKSMKHATIRELLRNRKCDTRGNKEKLIKILIMSYQNELACLTVQQLRPKLRRRKLSQQGTKKDIVRRLVEAGPISPVKA